MVLTLQTLAFLQSPPGGVYLQHQPPVSQLQLPTDPSGALRK